MQASVGTRSDGEMAARIRAYDWAATPLGPRERWPDALRVTVDLMLASPQPWWIGWGPAFIQLYNDAYVVWAGPSWGPLGQPTDHTAGDAWPAVEPALRAVLAGAASPSVAWRRGNGADAQPVGYATLSPIPDASVPGGIGGVLATLHDRPLATDTMGADASAPLRDAYTRRLSAVLRPLADPVEIQAVAAAALGTRLGVARVAYGEVQRDGEHLVIHRNYVGDGVQPITGRFRMADFGLSLVTRLRDGQPVVVDDVRTSPLLAGAEREAYLALGILSFAGVPLLKEGRFVANLNVQHNSPRAWSDDELAILADTAEATWAALERARAEEALQRQDVHYRALLDSMDQGLQLSTAERNAEGDIVDFTLTSANAAYGRHTGVPVAAVVGRRVSELAPDQVGLWIPYVRRVVDGGESFRVEERDPTTGRWFDTMWLPRGGDDFALLFTDVTARKEAENALRESEARLRMALEIGQLATWELNVRTGQSRWSERQFAMLGYTPGEIEPSYDAWLARVHPEDRPHLLPMSDVSRVIEVPFQADYRLQLPGGKLRWMSTTVGVFRNAEGAVERLAGVMQDVTDRKRAEESLREAVAERTAELHRANRSLTAMFRRLLSAQEDERRRIARDVHDHLGQQITALRRTLEGLGLVLGSDDALRKHLDRASRIATEIDQSIDTLSWSLRPAALDHLGLTAALRQGVSAWAKLFDIPASFTVADGVEDKDVSKERSTHVYRIVQEALHNIAKHARASHVAVSVACEGDDLVVNVQDDGRGLSASPARAGHQDDEPPMGMGLTNIRERAALLGGQCDVRSVPGQGTTVTVRIPL